MSEPDVEAGLGPQLARADALLQLGRSDEARRLLEPLAADHPDSTRLWCLLSLASLNGERPADALRAAERAIATDPHDEWAHRLRSLAAADLGLTQVASQAAREAVRLAPTSPYGQLVLGQALLEQGDLSEAANAAARAVELAPTMPDTHYVLARVATARGDTAAARAEYERTLELNPQHAPAMNNLGVLDLRAGKARRAGSRFRATSRTLPPGRVLLVARIALGRALIATWSVAMGVLIVSTLSSDGGQSSVPRWVRLGLVCVGAAASALWLRYRTRPLGTGVLRRTMRTAEIGGQRHWRVRMGVIAAFAGVTALGAVFAEPGPGGTGGPAPGVLVALLLGRVLAWSNGRRNR